jgi:hypothetical protein
VPAEDPPPQDDKGSNSSVRKSATEFLCMRRPSAKAMPADRLHIRRVRSSTA